MPYTYTCTNPYGLVVMDRRVGPGNQVTPADTDRTVEDGTTLDLRLGDVLVTDVELVHPYLAPNPPTAPAPPAARATAGRASSAPAALPPATT